MSVSTNPHTLRVLHLSDLHERVALDWMKADRKLKVKLGLPKRHRVLGPELERRLRSIVADRRPDLLVFTGDLADWGLPEEYALAKDRLQGLLTLLGLDWDRLFLVPGNHDIQRGQMTKTWRRMRDLAVNHQRRRELNLWLAGGPRPQGAPKDGLDLPATRQSGYRELLRKIGRPELLPDEARGHPRLGYRQSLMLPNLPQPVHIIGLDTAWLAGDNNDKGKLLLTEHQILQNATRDGRPLPGLRLGLMHHPLSDLADNDAHSLLSDHVDLVLHGHQHEPVSQEESNPDRTLRTLAAGSVYEGDEEDKWVNSFHVLDIRMNDAGRPLRYDVQFFGWSPGGHWHEHSALYRNAPLGCLSWEIGEATASHASHAPAPHPVPTGPFVGREAQLTALREVLAPNVGPVQSMYVCNLHGMAGVGKSFLVERFYADHSAIFPGGHLKLTLGHDESPTEERLMAVLAERLEVRISGDDPAPQLRMALKARRPLLHVDNVDAQAQAVAAVALVRRLTDVPIVLTGRYQFGRTTPGWRLVPIDPFSVPDALSQLGAELAHEVAALVPEAARHTLIGALGGLPLAIHLAASYLNAGYRVEDFLAELADRGLLMEPFTASDTAYLDRTVRALSATFELSMKALHAELGDEADAGVLGVAALGVAPLVGVGRSWMEAIIGAPPGKGFRWVCLAVKLSIVQHDVGAGRWRVHKLLAEHLRSLGDAGIAVARMDEWVLGRLAKEPSETRGNRWAELRAEHNGVSEWVRGLEGGQAVVGVLMGYGYAFASGPYNVWLGATVEALATPIDAQIRSQLLWCQGKLAKVAGHHTLALRSATEMAEHDKARGCNLGVAHAARLHADVLAAHGQLDEALRIRREEVLPAYDLHGDVRDRAAIRSEIVNLLISKRRLDEALKISRKEVLPVYVDLSDEREIANTMSRIASIHEARGELSEGLRIRREQVLPVYEQLGDERERFITNGKIADVLHQLSRHDEALQIFQTDVLPVCERLDDLDAQGVTMGKIADVLYSRGEHEEAIRIHREKVLPICRQLGDARGIAVTMGKIANMLRAVGKYDEALRILRDDTLPAIEQLGDKHAKAVTMGYLADVHQARGQLGKALHIQKDVLPVFKELGDKRATALTMNNIADILHEQGLLDEALRWQREELPLCRSLGDPHLLMVREAKLATRLIKRKRPEDVPEARALLLSAEASAIDMNLPTELSVIRSWFPMAGLRT